MQSDSAPDPINLEIYLLRQQGLTWPDIASTINTKCSLVERPLTANACHKRYWRTALSIAKFRGEPFDGKQDNSAGARERQKARETLQGMSPQEGAASRGEQDADDEEIVVLGTWETLGVSPNFQRRAEQVEDGQRRDSVMSGVVEGSKKRKMKSEDTIGDEDRAPGPARRATQPDTSMNRDGLTVGERAVLAAFSLVKSDFWPNVARIAGSRTQMHVTAEEAKEMYEQARFLED